MMRPVAQSPIQSSASRPIIAGGSPATAHNVPSPVQQQQEPPMSPTNQHATAEHHRRKRMYPDQITKAYSGEVPVSPGYPPQQQPYGSPGMANQQIQQQQQPQFISPMGTPANAAPYAQPLQQQQQPQQQTRQPAYVQPGYNAFIQDPVNQMTSQFGNMNMGGAAPVSRTIEALKWERIGSNLLN
jgi:protein transport protein SEC24